MDEGQFCTLRFIALNEKFCHVSSILKLHFLILLEDLRQPLDFHRNSLGVAELMTPVTCMLSGARDDTLALDQLHDNIFVLLLPPTDHVENGIYEGRGGGRW